MGYGNINGFRASYADSYPWFDLSKNEVTDLVVHPFFYMDTASVFQQQELPEAALNFIQNTTASCRGLVRELQLVFHPHALAGKGRRDLLTKILNQSALIQHPHL
jgi:endonuclease IV